MAVAVSAEIRFVRSLSHEDSNGCWIRNVAPRERGYTQIRAGGRNVCAHRFSYEMHRTEIPEGLTLDHLCRNPACVNPWHLEPVPQRVNMLRGTSPPAKAVATDLCSRGHVLNEKRRCNDCQTIKIRENPQRLERYQEYQRGYQRRRRAALRSLS